jgi:hypothetical protein
MGSARSSNVLWVGIEQSFQLFIRDPPPDEYSKGVLRKVEKRTSYKQMNFGPLLSVLRRNYQFLRVL